MGDVEEKIVDQGLEAFLNKDLPANAERIETQEAEKFDTAQSVPLTQSTKERLIYYLQKCLPENDVFNIMNLLDRVEGITESEGQRYLQAMVYASSLQIDKGFVDLILKKLTNVLMNPKDKKTKKRCRNDVYVKESTGDLLNSIIPYLGRLAGFLVFGFYVAESWNIKIKEDNSDEESEGRESKKQKQ